MRGFPYELMMDVCISLCNKLGGKIGRNMEERNEKHLLLFGRNQYGVLRLGYFFLNKLFTENPEIDLT